MSFENLPDELNLHILSKVEKCEDLENLFQKQCLSHLRYDRQLWKMKAYNEFNVEEWYFDLYLSEGREISAEERYSEIKNKFKHLSYSDIKRKEEIDEDKIVDFGLRMVHSFFYEISDEGFEILRSLGLESSTYPIGICYPAFYWIDSQELHTKGLQLLALMKDKNYKTVEEFLDLEPVKHPDPSSDCENPRSETSAPICPFLGILLALGDDEVFPLVEKKFELLSVEDRVVVLKFSTRNSSKLDHFIKLFNKETGCRFWMKYRPKSYTEQEFGEIFHSAYFHANLPIIEFLENKYGIDHFDITYLAALARGNLMNPQPIKVYKIIRRILDSQNEVYFPSSFTGDVDISHLFEKSGKEITTIFNYSSY